MQKPYNNEFQHTNTLLCMANTHHNAKDGHQREGCHTKQARNVASTELFGVNPCRPSFGTVRFSSAMKFPTTTRGACGVDSWKYTLHGVN